MGSVFTTAELEEMAAADAEIEASFRLEQADFELSRELDRIAISERATVEKRKAADQQKAWHEANRDKVADRHKTWYQANRDKALARQKAYREKNRDKVNAYMRAYRKRKRGR